MRITTFDKETHKVQKITCKNIIKFYIDKNGNECIRLLFEDKPPINIRKDKYNFVIG